MDANQANQGQANSNDTRTIYPAFLLLDSSVPHSASDRLSLVKWKETTKAPKLHANVAVSVPKIILDLGSHPTTALLTLHLQAAFEAMQDQVIRSLIETQIREERKTVPNLHVVPADITPAAVSAFLSAETISSRLKGENIETWFDTCVSDNLTLAIANKLSLPDEPSQEEREKLLATVTQHKTLLAKLAGPATSYQPKLAKQLLAALSLPEVTDLCDSDPASKRIHSYLSTRLTTFLTPKTDLLLAGLGD